MLINNKPESVLKKSMCKAKSRRLLKRFEEAVAAVALMGLGGPADCEAIDNEYNAARKAILKHMNRD